MFGINYGDRRPLYLQIKERFKEQIAAELLGEGEKMPSVRELAASMQINPNTIQKAYKELEAEGWIFSVPGKGSFVAPSGGRKNESRLAELRKSLDETVREMRFLGEDKESIISEINKLFT